ncbi:ComEA family DNA-binding protein [Noviherbaspirillum massiliense]|uniref:ComEA family DNA-binding protein n=1 Tax=Noviherbaspirillum massiliense TaxID=1465823 RepID=UPI000318B1EA|nr:DUF655 domain-containing protein [Noviherbaspirillum massiliense]
MFRKLLLAVATLVATMGFAFAQVDVNKADQAALDSVKGIGPKTSKAILDERKKGGDFKDWADFEKRVKGIGDKNAAKLSESGLTVNGQSKPGTSASAAKDKQKAAAAKDTKEAQPTADAGKKESKAADAKSADRSTKASDAKDAKKDKASK